MSEHISHHHDQDESPASLAWSRYAMCETADPDLFFPQPGADTAYARSICRVCPVRSECLEYALETRQKYGIWGGMTESQRRRLRRDDRSANHPARPRLRPAAEAGRVVIPAVAVTAVARPATSRQRHLQLVK